MERARSTFSRTRVIVLAAAVAVLLIPTSAATALSDPVVEQGSFNITSFHYEGGHVDYGFEAFFIAIGDWGGGAPTEADMLLNGGGDNLAIDSAEIHEIDPFDGSNWYIAASGTFEGEPPLGDYTIQMTDLIGSSDVFVVGELEDIPTGSSEILAGAGIVGPTPTFAWTPFQSEYLGTLVDPWAYELEFAMGDVGYSLFPIEPNESVLAFGDPRWQPAWLEPLSPGVYQAVLHSNHSVAPGFTFEHHVPFEFIVSGGGFVTGGGWIESLPGAFPPDPEVTGTANVGFNVKLDKTGTPQGSFNFVFQEGDVHFQADSFAWLVVGEDTAQFAGTGTVNGGGFYEFWAQVTEGNPDTLQLSISSSITGDGVYFTGEEEAVPLSGGNITIHHK